MSETERAIELVRKYVEHRGDCSDHDVSMLLAEHDRLVRERLELSAALAHIKQKHESSNLHREAEWLNELAGAINDAVYGDCQDILAARDASERQGGWEDGWISGMLHAADIADTPFCGDAARDIRKAAQIRSGELPLPPDAPGESEGEV